MKRLAGLALACAVLAAARPVRGELTVDVESSPDGETSVFHMTVTPAPAPVPALKHGLILRELDERDGNAAAYCYRAIMSVPNINKALRDKYGEESDWIQEALTDDEQGSLERIREAAALLPESTFDNLRIAASRPHCDWDWRLDEIRGPELYSFLLPEIQDSRQLCRMLLLRARVAIAERRYDDAIEILRINAAFGRHVAAEPLLVCGLVGIAISSMGERLLIDMIAAPDSPNMYWALTELPTPVISLRQAVRFEMGSGFRIFPFMLNAETEEHSSDEWSRLLAHGLMNVDPLSGGNTKLKEPAARLAVAGVALATYGPAKQRLIEGGLDAARVEQMPVGQVIALDAAREYRRISDQFEKRFYLPYRDAAKQAESFVEPFGVTKLKHGYGGILASLLVPSISAVRTAEVRLDWQTAGLRTVEAIRMQAAETGRLPKSLDEITIAPVPTNPATGQSFEYRLDGEMAVLELPLSDGFGEAWRFEIQLVK